jgi:hypothetical protein
MAAEAEAVKMFGLGEDQRKHLIRYMLAQAAGLGKLSENYCPRDAEGRSRHQRAALFAPRKPPSLCKPATPLKPQCGPSKK